jgi:hypothetical protein
MITTKQAYDAMIEAGIPTWTDTAELIAEAICICADMDTDDAVSHIKRVGIGTPAAQAIIRATWDNDPERGLTLERKLDALRFIPTSR